VVDVTFDTAAVAYANRGPHDYLLELNDNVIGDDISLMFDAGSLKGYTEGGH
jgi:hypothetical protein